MTCDCQDCVACLRRRLQAVTKARDTLAAVARTLADGDYPPSAYECRQMIEDLARVS